ncbi:MAG TPA: winged helix-turn-helix domain-containing protein, partial [Pyrinomonadaceae bacterium]|nr:winged helix-turn-helix domain-containing protein [Pyrinomonadaceae bacterium]
MHAYDFGPFRLIPVERRLLRDGRDVPLTPKLFDMLLLLVRRSGQLVRKEELMEEMWPDTAVQENNLTVSMSMVRKALGEGRDHARFIETVPKSGYRFIARVTEVGGEGDDRPPRPAAAEGAAKERAGVVSSLAVLPLANTSNDPNLEYLSDGITETIINNLSQLPSLKVMARSTVFRFKGETSAPVEVARELSVQSVLVGRVLGVGDRLVVRVELVDASDGSQLWGQQYDRPLSDIFAVQGEIARHVSEKLRLRLTSEERKRLAKRYTDDARAYQLYLKGRYFWNKFSREWVEKGIEHFQEAIAVEPNYALAYAGLADSYFRLSDAHMPPNEALPKAKAAALRAIELDEELSEGHASLGLIKIYYDHDWAGAEVEYQRAIELNPNSSIAHQRYGSYLMYIDRLEAAAAEYELAHELDPLSQRINLGMAANMITMGRLEQAHSQLQKTLELDPDYYPARHGLGVLRLRQGRYAESAAEFREVCRQQSDAYTTM